MSRKIADCREHPSISGCTLTLAGEEEELVNAATEHSVSVHGHQDTPELRAEIRKSLKDEPTGSGGGAFRPRGAVTKSFDNPDEVRPFKGHGQLKLVNFDEGHSIGKGTFEPGWKWSVDVKPLAGTESCQASHLGYVLKGAMTIRMDSGEETTVKAGEAFELEPGHDAWVVGDEAVELLDVVGFADYAIDRSVAEARGGAKEKAA